jgi:excisionase family DNA binding protein
MELEFMTCEEIAEILKLPISTIRIWCKKGKIKSSKFGKHHRILKSDFEKFLNKDC